MRDRAGLAHRTLVAKKGIPASNTGKSVFLQPTNVPAEQTSSLQRTIGNQAVQRLFTSGQLQAKFRISQPNDIYEQEADKVAEQVMQMTEPAVKTKQG